MGLCFDLALLLLYFTLSSLFNIASDIMFLLSLFVGDFRPQSDGGVMYKKRIPTDTPT